MRVLHLPFDGRNPYQRLLSEQLARMGVEVVPHRYPTWRLLDRALWVWKVDGLHFHWLDRFTSKRAIWRLPFDLVLLAAQLLLLRLLGLRIAWTVHNLQGHEGRNPSSERLLARLICGLAHVVFVHGEVARQQVVTRFKVAPERIVVIPHGNYIGWYADHVSGTCARALLGLHPTRTTLLFLGNVRGYKGVVDLIRDYTAMADECTQLVIAGMPVDDDFRRELQGQVKDRDDIHLRLEFIPDDDVQLYMKAADAVVFPYRKVLSSGALVLAMGFGRACIAPRLGCIPEMLDTEGGFLYDADDDDGLRHALVKAVDRVELLEAMGRHNRARAEAWSWQGVARSTHAGYLGEGARTATSPDAVVQLRDLMK